MKSTAALTDRTMEETPGERAGLQHGNAIGAGGLPEDGDVVRVAAEFRNVGANPMQRLDLIAIALVARDATSALGGQFGMREVAETTQAIVDGHHHRAVSGEQPARVHGARSRLQAAAVDPHHDRTPFPGMGGFGPDIQRQAIFALLGQQRAGRRIVKGNADVRALNAHRTRRGRIENAVPRDQGTTGAGGAQRRSPTGGAA